MERRDARTPRARRGWFEFGMGRLLRDQLCVLRHPQFSPKLAKSNFLTRVFRKYGTQPETRTRAGCTQKVGQDDI